MDCSGEERRNLPDLLLHFSPHCIANTALWISSDPGTDPPQCSGSAGGACNALILLEVLAPLPHPVQGGAAGNKFSSASILIVIIVSVHFVM